MPVTVEIDMFSGLPNPTYLLSPSGEAAFRTDVLRASNNAPIRPGLRRLDDQVPGRERNGVGYGGLRVYVTGPEASAPGTYAIGNGIGSGPAGDFYDSNRALEAKLLSQVSEKALDQTCVEVGLLLASDPPDQPIRRVSSLGRPPDCTGALKFPGAKSIWRKNLDDNNCYNYALNLHCDDSRNPAGVTTPQDDETWVDLVRDDGHQFLRDGFPETCPIGSYFVVLCVVVSRTNPRDNFGPYHCLRLDEDGWSHKFGSDPIANKDGAGQPMTSLATMRFRYALLACGAFLVRRNLRC